MSRFVINLALAVSCHVWEIIVGYQFVFSCFKDLVVRIKMYCLLKHLTFP